jgi:D-glycero-alpha-D-manno-heptose-7-phosphate kinase
MKICRARAPLRIGLAGGGTDVSPYCDIYGGAILNAAISLFAHATIEQIDNGEVIIFESVDLKIHETYKIDENIPTDGPLVLLKGVFNKIIIDYNLPKRSFKLITKVDAPAGSGLGSSSTLVVAIIGAFKEFYNIPLSDYDIAKYAYRIERIDLSLRGGKQDQYAATFGGFNYMEFYKDEKVIVNPLKIKNDYINELENNLVLFFTSTSRSSSEIIKEQQNNVTSNNKQSIEAMHQLKQQALEMKEALLLGNLKDIGKILHFGFEQKIKMAKSITNYSINLIYNAAISAGSTGGKISGAGGGGFMFFYCPSNSRYKVINSLSQFEGNVASFLFEETGLHTWTIN